MSWEGRGSALKAERAFYSCRANFALADAQRALIEAAQHHGAKSTLLQALSLNELIVRTSRPAEDDAALVNAVSRSENVKLVNFGQCAARHGFKGGALLALYAERQLLLKLQAGCRIAGHNRNACFAAVASALCSVDCCFHNIILLSSHDSSHDRTRCKHFAVPLGDDVPALLRCAHIRRTLVCIEASARACLQVLVASGVDFNAIDRALVLCSVELLHLVRARLCDALEDDLGISVEYNAYMAFNACIGVLDHFANSSTSVREVTNSDETSSRPWIRSLLVKLAANALTTSSCISAQKYPSENVACSSLHIIANDTSASGSQLRSAIRFCLAQMRPSGMIEAHTQVAELLLKRLEYLEGISEAASITIALDAANLLMRAQRGAGAQQALLAAALKRWQKHVAGELHLNAGCLRLVARVLQQLSLHESAADILQYAVQSSPKRECASVNRELVRAEAAASRWKDCLRKRAMLSVSEREWVRVVSRRVNGAVASLGGCNGADGRENDGDRDMKRASGWQRAVLSESRKYESLIDREQRLHRAQPQQNCVLGHQKGSIWVERCHTRSNLSCLDAVYWVELMAEANDTVLFIANCRKAGLPPRVEPALNTAVLRLGVLARRALAGARCIIEESANLILRRYALHVSQHVVYNAAAAAVIVLRDAACPNRNEHSAVLQQYMTERSTMSSGIPADSADGQLLSHSTSIQVGRILLSCDEPRVQDAQMSLELHCVKILRSTR